MPATAPLSVQSASTASAAITVVIPAFNEQDCLAATLRALQAQDYPAGRVEVIVVDNGSTDRTREIAAALGARVLVRPGVTIAALRNAGAAEARGEILAFLDADCVPAPDWARQAAERLSTGSCVTGARVRVPPDGTWIETAWFAERSAGSREVRYINSGNMLMARHIFETIGGFDSRLVTGEDSELCRRARAVAPIIADDAIRATHLGYPKTVRQFLKREIWHGTGGVDRTALTIRNKPLLGAMAVTGLTVLMIAAVIAWPRPFGPAVFAASSTALGALLLASAVQRVGWKAGIGRLARVTCLYYVYYLGRAIALGRRMVGLGPPSRMRGTEPSASNSKEMASSARVTRID